MDEREAIAVSEEAKAMLAAGVDRTIEALVAECVETWFSTQPEEHVRREALWHRACALKETVQRIKSAQFEHHFYKMRTPE